MLRGLNSHFNLYLDDHILQDYATPLGADCPFFITGEPTLAHGIGDQFTPVSLTLKGTHIILIVPPKHTHQTHPTQTPTQ